MAKVLTRPNRSPVTSAFAPCRSVRLILGASAPWKALQHREHISRYAFPAARSPVPLSKRVNGRDERPRKAATFFPLLSEIPGRSKEGTRTLLMRVASAHLNPYTRVRVRNKYYNYFALLSSVAALHNSEQLHIHLNRASKERGLEP